LSVEAWVYPTDTTGTRPIVSKQSATRGYSLELNSGQVTFSVINSSGSTERVTSTTTLSTGAWHHVIGVRNSSTGRISIYVNGVFENEALLSGTYGGSSTDFYIGRKDTDYFAGRIDEVVIYNSVITPTRISDHLSAATVPTCYSTTAPAAGSWNHLAATFDGVSKDLKLYVNGSIECTRASTGFTLSGSGSALTFGVSLSGGSPEAGTYWNGSVGDVRIYNSVLDSTQVMNNHNVSSGRFP